MSEGGLFSWKIQKIRRHSPTGDCSDLRDPLPDAPQGMVWYQNKETGEWKLVPAAGVHVEVDRFPTEEKENGGEDWELLSDRVSMGSLGGAAIFVPRGESVRSLTSLDNSSTNLSHPFRIQRTLSSSTIDSADGTFNSCVGVLGVDYVEHVVLPTDTLQGLCLAYKISATRLRQANHFSGSSLLLAPKKLIIPMTKKAIRSGFIRVQDKESREYKLHAFLAELHTLKETDARAYLEMADWIVEEAVRSAREDGEWEKEVQDDGKRRTNDICISVDIHNGVPVGFQTKGAGIPPRPETTNAAVTKRVDMTIYEEDVPADKPTVHTRDVYGAGVRPLDVYNAADEHNEYGVEMKPLPNKPIID